MNDLKDFTKAQARAWVAQELAKAKTNVQCLRRISSERETQRLATQYKLPAMPNSAWAHDELIRRLAAKLEAL